MSEFTENHGSAENLPVESFVEATLNYLRRVVAKPVIYTYEPPSGIPRTTGKSEPRSVLIRNARLAEQLSLDREGYQLVNQETAVQDFHNRDEVQAVYYPEIEQLFKKATGAEKVVVFDHQLRNIQLYRRGEKQARDYASTVQNDYTTKSGPRRVRDQLPPAEAEERLQHRFAEITPDQYEGDWRVNAFGAFLAAKEVHPA